MTESMTVIVEGDPAAMDQRENAELTAENFPSDILSGLIHQSHCHKIAEYPNEEAKTLIDTALEETRKKTRVHLDIIKTQLSETEHNNLPDLINDREFTDHLFKAASVEPNGFELYDSTSHQNGTPITTHERVKEIIERVKEQPRDKRVFVAEITFER